MRDIKFRATYENVVYNIAIRKPLHRDAKGWYKNHGYIYRLVTEHPFMTKRGYVKEHRLIMEQHLGKILEPWEKIHHRDQNRENNELSNLELFGHQSKHSYKHLQGKRNSHGQFICKEPIFSELKFRLYNVDTKTTYIYTLATLISTTFRRGKFKFRGRFTGLKNKKGKEIYEGDILRHYHKYGKHQSIVKWEDKMEGSEGQGHAGFYDTECYGDVEIIGNIYSNPELLK